MKRIAIIITILSVFFSSSMVLWAESDPKDINVILSDTPAVVNVGETVRLTATAPKHGSTFVDSWNDATKTLTEYDLATGNYISTASFSAENPGIYNISYTITMSSGNSSTTFTKRVERTIEVIDTSKVIGAVIKDLKVTPIYKADGSISLYSASGTTHALWSNNTTTQSGSIYFYFGPNETTKDIEVTVYIDNQPFTYIVTVNR